VGSIVCVGGPELKVACASRAEAGADEDGADAEDEDGAVSDAGRIGLGSSEDRADEDSAAMDGAPSGEGRVAVLDTADGVCPLFGALGCPSFRVYGGWEKRVRHAGDRARRAVSSDTYLDLS
jgi:hypothetical protein